MHVKTVEEILDDDRYVKYNDISTRVQLSEETITKAENLNIDEGLKSDPLIAYLLEVYPTVTAPSNKIMAVELLMRGVTRQGIAAHPTVDRTPWTLSHWFNNCPFTATYRNFRMAQSMEQELDSTDLIRHLQIAGKLAAVQSQLTLLENNTKVDSKTGKVRFIDERLVLDTTKAIIAQTDKVVLPTAQSEGLAEFAAQIISSISGASSTLAEDIDSIEWEQAGE